MPALSTSQTCDVVDWPVRLTLFRAQNPGIPFAQGTTPGCPNIAPGNADGSGRFLDLVGFSNMVLKYEQMFCIIKTNPCFG
jgi:hypothetical protein